MVASALALAAHLVGLSGDDDGSSVVMAHLASLCGRWVWSWPQWQRFLVALTERTATTSASASYHTEATKARAKDEEVGQVAEALARKKEQEMRRIKFLARHESDPGAEGVEKHNNKLRRR